VLAHRHPASLRKHEPPSLQGERPGGRYHHPSGIDQLPGPAGRLVLRRGLGPLSGSFRGLAREEGGRVHGSKGSHVFRDPNEDDRVWVLFDWDAEGWQSFVSDPEVPPILQETGHKGKPQAAELGGQYDA
jgi:hypothetical protein